MIGVDIDGLNPEDQSRIRAIGLSAWLDEVAPVKQNPSRHSLEYQQAQMKKRLEKKNGWKRRSRTLPDAKNHAPAH
jgi:hypothetical protein